MSSFRVGIVTLQDPSNCRVRVVFPDRDQLQTWWLPVVVAKTQNDKAYYLPDVGEQVVCLMDDHNEDGAVLGAIYSTQDMPPGGISADKIHWSARDGAVFEYDRAQHAFTLALPAAATLSVSAANGHIQIDAAGNISITTNGIIQLGNGASRGVARLGDTVSCPAGRGTITSASLTVQTA